MEKSTLPGKVIQAPPQSSPKPDKAQQRVSISGTFASLRYRNYRLWFTGQMVSLVGTWMQSTAQAFLVYQLTGSPAYLGYVGFAAGVPAILFSLHGGMISDRMSKRNLMVLTQSAMMILAFLLAALTFSGRVQAWHIIVLAFLLGIANAFDAPARQAIVLELVEREDLTNAIALNATMFNLGTAIGPAVAGLTYSAFGPAWCFVINGISFLAVILALLMMKLKPVAPSPRTETALSEIRQGLGYVSSNRRVRTIIINLGVISLFGMAFVTLMPAWAVDVLGGNATTNGLLQSARGVGALVGGLMLAAIGGFVPREKFFTWGSFTFPILLFVYAFLRWLPLSLICLAGVGWGFMVLVNSSNVMVQTQVPDELRGRVMSIYTLAFFGLMPFGAFIAGRLAEQIGEPATVVAGALVLLGVALWMHLRVPEVSAAS
jgi:MFS family permease